MDIWDMTPDVLARYFDETLLKAYATDADFQKFCARCVAYRFRSAMVSTAQAKRCKELLKGSGVLLGVTVGFPLGQTTVEVKVAEAAGAIADGADEIDYVINIGELKSGNCDYVEREMRAITELCHKNGKAVKVIFENCYLTDEEKKTLCRIAKRVKPDFIKTSTGFGTPASGIPVGATAEDVRLMKSEVGDTVKVKAAGGIRTLESVLMMIQAGAERIGTSSGASIMEELKSLQNANLGSRK